MSWSALSLMALPCVENICAFSINKSLLSIPGPLGFAPTRKAKLLSPKALAASSVVVTLPNVGKAQSSNSIATPLSASSAGVISSRFKLIVVELPSNCPDAILNANW